MRPRTQHPGAAGAALAVAAVVIAGAVWQVKPATGQEKPSAQKDNVPTVPYWHVWTDENGVSHQKRCAMSAFQFQSISPGAAPSWIDRQSTPGAHRGGPGSPGGLGGRVA